MGKIFADIKLINGDDSALVRRKKLDQSELRSMNISILVDTGAYNLAVNERIANQLGLSKLGEQTFKLADGSEQVFDIVGPVDIVFENRETTCRAVLLPGNTEPLLGQIPLEDMDVVLLPKEEKMIVNPESPYMARKDLK
jgi:clan AA aspartic protease